MRNALKQNQPLLITIMLRLTDGVSVGLGPGLRTGRSWWEEPRLGGGAPLQVLQLLHQQGQVLQQIPVLEEQLVDLVVYAMERSETEEHFDADVGGTSQLLWQHLSSQLIFFVLFQFASFPHMVLSLHQKVRPAPPGG